MFKKLKDNLGLVVTGIALMSSVGAGIQSLNAVLVTLTGIDDRMNTIEYEFVTLKDSTYVQNTVIVCFTLCVNRFMVVHRLTPRQTHLARHLIHRFLFYSPTQQDIRFLPLPLSELTAAQEYYQEHPLGLDNTYLPYVRRNTTQVVSFFQH